MLNLWIFIGLMMACAAPEPSKRARLTGSSVTNSPNPEKNESSKDVEATSEKWPSNSSRRPPDGTNSPTSHDGPDGEDSLGTEPGSDQNSPVKENRLIGYIAPESQVDGFIKGYLYDEDDFTRVLNLSFFVGGIKGIFFTKSGIPIPPTGLSFFKLVSRKEHLS